MNFYSKGTALCRFQSFRFYLNRFKEGLKMKKSLIAAALFSLALAACGDKAADTAASAASEAASAATEAAASATEAAATEAASAATEAASAATEAASAATEAASAAK